MDKLTEQQFLGCVAEHQMIVLLDNGVYRHIRFKAPSTNNQYFDLVTWPNYLSFSGDMGSYVFSRVNDMFNFFTGNGINPGYWSEKLEASDRSNGYNGFSAEKFGELITRECEDQLHDLLARREIDQDEAQDVRDELEDALADVEFEHEANALIDSFNINKVRFSDFGEYDCNEYTYHYLWACYAIQWGVAKYFAEISEPDTKVSDPC
ncbi:MAG: hypothetical protein BWK73_09095 [Thiothrix lacustris]|uniref:Uncharacterized protein n=1 Tax=Thiothrix lacustris TaxID=525917 RepID=A0A1Y1QUZ4_9GAMM|nr:MAG: hypothetical protein BWK73_09095 [Thiothrix lacustris]